jgi:hypothetical protein
MVSRIGRACAQRYFSGAASPARTLIAMTVTEACARLTGARVAHLATAGSDGRPHVVPCTFAVLDGATIVSPVDHKPKRNHRPAAAGEHR